MKNTHWLWKIYFAYFATLMLNQTVNLFQPLSSLYSFYHILMAFDAWLSILYIVRIICELLNLINLIPFFLFVFDIEWLDKKFWKWAVILRIVFDVLGHYYEFVFIKSLWYANPIGVPQVILWAVITIIPSYYACITYAFGERATSPHKTLRHQ